MEDTPLLALYRRALLYRQIVEVFCKAECFLYRILLLITLSSEEACRGLSAVIFFLLLIFVFQGVQY